MTARARELRNRLAAIYLSAERQLEELEAIKKGTRRSSSTGPLGSKLILNVGAELQFLLKDIELWAKEFETPIPRSR